MMARAEGLDLNSATVEQLSNVKCFDKTVAEAIVNARPYRCVDSSAEKKIVSGAALPSEKNQAVVR